MPATWAVGSRRGPPLALWGEIGGDADVGADEGLSAVLDRGGHDAEFGGEAGELEIAGRETGGVVGDGIAGDAKGGKLGVFDAEEGEIGVGVGGDKLGGLARAVGEYEHDGVGLFNDVFAGEDQAVVANGKAGGGAQARAVGLLAAEGLIAAGHDDPVGGGPVGGRVELVAFHEFFGELDGGFVAGVVGHLLRHHGNGLGEIFGQAFAVLAFRGAGQKGQAALVGVLGGDDEGGEVVQGFGRIGAIVQGDFVILD